MHTQMRVCLCVSVCRYHGLHAGGRQCILKCMCVYVCVCVCQMRECLCLCVSVCRHHGLHGGGRQLGHTHEARRCPHYEHVLLQGPCMCMRDESKYRYMYIYVCVCVYI